MVLGECGRASLELIYMTVLYEQIGDIVREIYCILKLKHQLICCLLVNLNA